MFICTVVLHGVIFLRFTTEDTEFHKVFSLCLKKPESLRVSGDEVLNFVFILKLSKETLRDSVYTVVQNS